MNVFLSALMYMPMIFLLDWAGPDAWCYLWAFLSAFVLVFNIAYPVVIARKPTTISFCLYDLWGLIRLLVIKLKLPPGFLAICGAFPSGCF